MKFDKNHRETLQDILKWRRDVRHFRPDQLPAGSLEILREAMDLAPSVGNARPWRVIQVESDQARSAVIENFQSANTDAARIYSSEKRKAYDALKLEGLQTAPVHLAIFTDSSPVEGAGLGRQSMPEMLAYSTVTAIHTLWLTARSLNIGVGWVSILDPIGVSKILDCPENWSLTGYLCIGIADANDDTPLLHRNSWQENTASSWETR